jgi:hypothetical protein
MQANSHTFPNNDWIDKFTKRKELDKCDLCKALRWAEDSVTTEEDLPKQDLGHIQHTCEDLSAAHIDEIPSEIEGLQYLHLTQDAI